MCDINKIARTCPTCGKRFKPKEDPERMRCARCVHFDRMAEWFAFGKTYLPKPASTEQDEVPDG